MNDVHDGRVHVCCCEILIGTDVDILQRLAQHLSLLHIDGNELQDTILGDDADDHFTVGLIVYVDDWYAASTRSDHHATSFVEGLQWVNGYCLNRSDCNGLLDLCGDLVWSVYSQLSKWLTS